MSATQQQLDHYLGLESECREDCYAVPMAEAKAAAEAAEDAGTQQLIRALELLSPKQRSESLRRAMCEIASWGAGRKP